MLTRGTLSSLPTTAAGARARWVLERLAVVAAGGAAPNSAELHEQYTSGWLAEVQVARTFEECARLTDAITEVHDEAARTDEVKLLLDLADGHAVRFRCAVEKRAPHRIKFQLFSPAMPPSSCAERVVRRDGRSVHIRDYGGDGPLMLLWHGAGCDATIWDAMIPSLRAFRVLAQDLPGHGASPLQRLSVSDTLADTRALLANLNAEVPILVGHSMGGWIALHYAATSPCKALVCLDGPSNLDYAAMGITAEHPGWMPDPPDVRSDLGALDCPTLVTLSCGTSTADQELMVPFRTGLSEYLAEHHPAVEVVWQHAGHMNVISVPRQTAQLIEPFVRLHSA